jgi:RNA polymerase sigma-70 factor (ECF subfamily)
MGRHAANQTALVVGGAFPAQTPPRSDQLPKWSQLDDDEVDAIFDALVAPHQAALRAYVRQFTEGDDDITDSVVKETLYRAAQELSCHPQRDSTVGLWLLLTARNVAHDGARLAPAGHDDRPSPRRRDQRFAAKVAKPAGTVVLALDNLSGVHRDILVELFYRGVSLEEAAAVRGVTVQTVKSRLYFAMRALRAVLDQQIADRHAAAARP